MNTPNKLTIARVIMTPIFMALMLIDFPFHYLLALAVFGAASFTDALDGKIARDRGLITDFGKFSDPLADKMLTTAAFIGFLAKGVGYGTAWVLFIILFREFLMSSLRLVAVSSEKKTVIAANVWGKAKTVTQMISIMVALALLEISELFNLFEKFHPLYVAFDAIIAVMFWVCALLTVISGVVYLKDNFKYINPGK